MGEELRRFDGKLDIRSCEKPKTLPMWHTFWKGKLEFGLISFWIMVLFILFYLQTLCTVFPMFDRLLAQNKASPQKTSTTFFPKSSPSKTEYHLATKKGPTSSNPVACCHFVKESHGFSLRPTSLPLSSYIEVVRAPSQR